MCMSMQINSTGVIGVNTGQKKEIASKQSDNKAIENQKEVVSKEGSNAVRSSAMAGIKLNRTMTIQRGEETYKVEGKYRVIGEMPTEEANMFWTSRGYTDSPYKEGQTAEIIELKEPTRFVRTYDGMNSGKAGSWVMKYEDVKGLTAEQIADKFALPQVPKFICDAEFPAGTALRTGECNPLYGWNGGGKQYDLMGVRTGNFTNEREIGAAAK